MKRVRELAFPPGVSQLVNVHILDLAKDGFIKPHVDSVRVRSTELFRCGSCFWKRGFLLAVLRRHDRWIISPVACRASSSSRSSKGSIFQTELGIWM
jgi:hypothetical protein